MVDAGWGHSIALLSDGSVKEWGLNNTGQLGDGTTSASLTPVSVAGLDEAVKIACGDYHNFAWQAGKHIFVSDVIGEAGGHAYLVISTDSLPSELKLASFKVSYAADKLEFVADSGNSQDVRASLTSNFFVALADKTSDGKLDVGLIHSTTQAYPGLPEGPSGTLCMIRFKILGFGSGGSVHSFADDLSGQPASAFDVVSGIRGDVNGDGYVTVLDLIEVLKFIWGEVAPTADEAWSSDYNVDGRISVLDVLSLLNFLWGNTDAEAVLVAEKAENLSRDRKPGGG